MNYKRESISISPETQELTDADIQALKTHGALIPDALLKEVIVNIDTDKIAECIKSIHDVLKPAVDKTCEIIINFMGCGEHIKAIEKSIANEISYSSNDRKIIKAAIGQTDDKYAINTDLLTKFLSEEPQRTAIIAAYLMSGDSESESYYVSNYGETMPIYHKNSKLDKIYDFLCALGYQMSEEEKQLQNCTHILFEVKK